MTNGASGTAVARSTFEASTKHTLGQLNEKMDRLERQVSHAEGAITAAVDQLKK